MRVRSIWCAGKHRIIYYCNRFIKTHQHKCTSFSETLPYFGFRDSVLFLRVRIVYCVFQSQLHHIAVTWMHCHILPSIGIRNHWLSITGQFLVLFDAFRIASIMIDCSRLPICCRKLPSVFLFSRPPDAWIARLHSEH